MVGALLFTYCSNENLIRDTYLRRNMDEQGWVPINLIAGFTKVSFLGNLWLSSCFFLRDKTFDIYHT